MSVIFDGQKKLLLKLKNELKIIEQTIGYKIVPENIDKWYVYRRFGTSTEDKVYPLLPIDFTGQSRESLFDFLQCYFASTKVYNIDYMFSPPPILLETHACNGEIEHFITVGDYVRINKAVIVRFTLYSVNVNFKSIEELEKCIKTSLPTMPEFVSSLISLYATDIKIFKIATSEKIANCVRRSQDLPLFTGIKQSTNIWRSSEPIYKRLWKYVGN